MTKLRVGCLVLGMLGLLCMAAPVVYVLWVRSVDRERVAELKAAIRARGEPVTVAELEAFAKIDDSIPDTTALWQRALELAGDNPALSELLPHWTRKPRPLPLEGEPWPSPDEVEQFLADHAEWLARIETAAATPGRARFSPDYAQGLDMELGHISRLHRCAQVLSAAIALEIHRGDGTRAREHIDAVLSIYDQLESDPVLVGLLIGATTDSNAVMSICEAASAGILSESDLRELRVRLSSRDYKPLLFRAMCTERVLAVAAHDQSERVREIGGASEWFGVMRGVNPHADLLFTLRLFEQLTAGAKLPADARLNAADRFTREFQVSLREASLWEKFSKHITYLLVFTLEEPARLTVRTEALRDITLVIIGLELYRQREGKLPATLADLVPADLDAVPLDPYDGQPLRYRVEGNEALVWAVGKDRVDDQGAEGETFGEPDLALRLRSRAAP